MALVSVIIPTHNDADYLPDSVGSVLNYDGQHDIEIIIIDDGSEPPASEKYQPEDGRVLIIRQEARGVSAARNAGLEKAQGEYILFLDADDIALPGRIDAQVGLLERQPDIGLVGTDVTYRGLDAQDDSWGVIEAFGADIPRRKLGSDDLRFDGAFADLALHHFPFNTTVIAVRRSLIDGDNPLCFDTDLLCWEDWDFVARAARRAAVGYVRRPLTLYRKRPGSITSTDDPRKFTGRAAMFRKWRKEFSGLSAPQKKHLKKQECESLITASYLYRDTDRMKAVTTALRLCTLSLRMRSLRTLVGSILR